MVSTGKLAVVSARHPKKTLAIWMALLVAAFVAIGSFIDGTMTTEFYFYNNPDSKKADTLLEERLRGPADVKEVVIVRSAELTVDDTAYQEHVTGLRDEISGLGEGMVASVASYYQTDDESMVSADRHTTILPIVIAGKFKVQGGRV